MLKNLKCFSKVEKIRKNNKNYLAFEKAKKIQKNPRSDRKHQSWKNEKVTGETKKYF